MAPVFLQNYLHITVKVKLKFMSCNFAQKAFEGKFNSSPLYFNNLPVDSPSNCKIKVLRQSSGSSKTRK